MSIKLTKTQYRIMCSYKNSARNIIWRIFRRATTIMLRGFIHFYFCLKRQYLHYNDFPSQTNRHFFPVGGSEMTWNPVPVKKARSSSLQPLTTLRCQPNCTLNYQLINTKLQRHKNEQHKWRRHQMELRKHRKSKYTWQKHNTQDKSTNCIKQGRISY